VRGGDRKYVHNPDSSGPRAQSASPGGGVGGVGGCGGVCGWGVGGDSFCKEKTRAINKGGFMRKGEDLFMTSSVMDQREKPAHPTCKKLKGPREKRGGKD